ncbi:MAG: serine/threonine-protein kinase [Desulfatiglans sp.]|jgi:serine/threonine-protein kinase|nr:serine/threonine-protein kinase [Desulfatiglans sp.]
MTMKKKQVIPHWIIGVVITPVFLLCLVGNRFTFTGSSEMKAFDLMAGFVASDLRNPDIELVVITDEDQSELGAFPWSRDLFAQAIHNLVLAGAKVIALNMLFPEPEERRGLEVVQRLKDRYEILELHKGEEGVSFFNDLSEALVDLDGDRGLSEAVKKAGNVILPVHFDSSTSGDVDLDPPEFLGRHAFKRLEETNKDQGESTLIFRSKLSPFLPSLVQGAAGIGHINFFPDQDGTLRSSVHVLGYLKDMYFPSYPLAIVKLFRGLEDKDILICPGKKIQLRLGPSHLTEVPVIDTQMRTLVNWGRGPGIVFHRTPFADVLKNEVKTSLFKDKIVIIGLEVSGMSNRLKTPVFDSLSETEVVANSVANLLSHSSYSRPAWAELTEIIVTIIFGLFLVFFLPQLKMLAGAIASMGLMIGYIGGVTYVLHSLDVWLRIIPPLFLLAVGSLLVMFNSLWTRKGNSGEISETDSVDIAGMEVHYGEGPQGPDVDATVDQSAFNRIASYGVIGEIERDSTGVAYRGIDHARDRTVIIEAVDLAQFDQDIRKDVRNRFLREAESRGALVHPNISAPYDYGEEEGLVYAAMESFNGKTLKEYLRPEGLHSLRDALDLMAQALEGLAYIHSRGMVHLAIRPTNILWDQGSRRVKVTGFGLCTLASAYKTPPNSDGVGTAYLSPEQVSGKRVDGRSDIFSSGVVLFEILTGRKPFVEEDLTSLMLKIARERHPSAKELNPVVPNVVERILNKALEKSPDKRYQKAGHMGRHLSQVVAKIDEVLYHKWSP